jgi:hypothetical protein
MSYTSALGEETFQPANSGFVIFSAAESSLALTGKRTKEIPDLSSLLSPPSRTSTVEISEVLRFGHSARPGGRKHLKSCLKRTLPTGNTLPKPNVVSSTYVSSGAKAIPALLCSKTFSTEATGALTFCGNTSHPGAASRLQSEVFRIKVFCTTEHILRSLQTLVKQLLIGATEGFKFRTLSGQERFFFR